MWHRCLLILAGMALLCACQPPLPSATPPSTAQVVTVQYTPGLRPWLAEIQTCGQEIAGIGLAVREVSGGRLDPAQADLSLRIGAPLTGNNFAADLGRVNITVIAHAQNPVHSLTPDELRAIYTGALRDWSEINPEEGSTSPPPAHPIQVWTYLPGDDIRESFETSLQISGALGKETYTAPDPAAMLQAVGENPDAIGFIPEFWDDQSTLRIQITGTPDGSLQSPVIALSRGEPEGKAHQYLGCLQQKNLDR